MPFPTQKTVGKYREISENLANPSLLSELKSLFNRRYSLAELLDWIHETVKWDKGEIVRHNNPVEIIAYGKGRCGEFGILPYCFHSTGQKMVYRLLH